MNGLYHDWRVVPNVFLECEIEPLLGDHKTSEQLSYKPAEPLRGDWVLHGNKKLTNNSQILQESYHVNPVCLTASPEKKSVKSLSPRNELRSSASKADVGDCTENSKKIKKSKLLINQISSFFQFFKS